MSRQVGSEWIETLKRELVGVGNAVAADIGILGSEGGPILFFTSTGLTAQANFMCSGVTTLDLTITNWVGIAEMNIHLNEFVKTYDGVLLHVSVDPDGRLTDVGRGAVTEQLNLTTRAALTKRFEYPEY